MVVIRSAKALAPVAMALFTLAANHASAAVIYVDDNAIGAANGSSWTDAFTSLHGAFEIAQPGDEIRVAQGTYKPAGRDGDRDATFLVSVDLVLQGGYAGFGAPDPDALDPAAYPTVITGDLNGNDQPPIDFQNFTNASDNSRHVLTLASSVTTATQLRGVTVTGGSADSSSPVKTGAGLHCPSPAGITLVECVFTQNQAQDAGGGIDAAGGAVHAASCLFTHNRTMAAGGPGGAMRIARGSFSQCAFQKNFAGALVPVGPGAAVFCSSATPASVSFDQCTFKENGGGTAAVIVNVSDASFTSCLFQGNGGDHGAIYVGSGATAAVERCDFLLNSCLDGAGVYASTGTTTTLWNCRFLANQSDEGGAVLNRGSLTAVNCLFSGNFTTSSGGGAIFNRETGALKLINCSVVGNTADWRGGGVYDASGGMMTSLNSVFWDNHDIGFPSVPQFPGTQEKAQISSNGPDSALSIKNTCLMGWTGVYGGSGNFGDDPQLIDADGPDSQYGTTDDDPRLGGLSPCRDEGNNDHLPLDAADLDGDSSITETLPLDFDDLPRVVNGVVDIGAFEHQGAACVADVFPAQAGPGGDGHINADDLFAMINAWGACPASDLCPNDVDNDGFINIDDLALIINQWGECATKPER